MHTFNTQIEIPSPIPFDRGAQDKKHQRVIPSGGQWGLFGLHTVPPDAKSVVLCEVCMAALVRQKSIYGGVGAAEIKLDPWHINQLIVFTLG